MTITPYYSVEVLKIHFYADVSGGFHIPVTAIIEFSASNYAYFDDLRPCISWKNTADPTYMYVDDVDHAVSDGLALVDYQSGAIRPVLCCSKTSSHINCSSVWECDLWTTLAGGVYMRPFCITLQEMMPM